MQGGAAGQPSSSGTGCSNSRLETIQSVNGNDICIAKLVTIGTAGLTFGIDATEVTRGQYDSWLATGPALPPTTDAQCGWNASYSPADTTSSSQYDYPVFVDWCDAYAYCASVGKHLCSKIGGGTLSSPSELMNATASQWFAACSSGGLYTYPYGDSYLPMACNTKDFWSGSLFGPLPVASLEGCQSPASGYAGVYDLSGNAPEWEDNCNTNYDGCPMRGVSAWMPTPTQAQYVHCAFVHPSISPHLSAGIRCCSG